MVIDHWLDTSSLAGCPQGATTHTHWQGKPCELTANGTSTKPCCPQRSFSLWCSLANSGLHVGAPCCQKGKIKRLPLLWPFQSVLAWWTRRCYLMTNNFKLGVVHSQQRELLILSSFPGSLFGSFVAGTSRPREAQHSPRPAESSELMKLQHANDRQPEQVNEAEPLA